MQVFGRWCKNETLFAAYRHSYCKSVQEEIEDLLSKNIVQPEQVKEQWQKYVEWGLSKFYVLFSIY